MIPLLLNTFGTWLAYFLLRDFCRCSQAGAALIVITASILVYWRNLFQRRYLMSWLNQLLFALIYLNAARIHSRFFEDYTTAISYSLFAIAGVGSLLINRPFTLQYARQSVSPERWSNPLFQRINFTLSAVWSAVFVFNAAVNCLPALGDRSWILRSLSVSLTSLAVIFTVEYPAWSVNRAKISRPC